MSSETSFVTVVGYYASRPQKIFSAWLDPELVGQFIVGPRVRENEEVLSVQIDPKVGGRFLFVTKRDGQRFERSGEYHEIKRPLRLAFTWNAAQAESPSLVRIEIVGFGTGCQLTLHHEIPSTMADSADRTKEAWTKILDVLSDVLEE